MIFMISGSTATNLFAATRPTVAVQLPVYKSEIFQERADHESSDPVQSPR